MNIIILIHYLKFHSLSAKMRHSTKIIAGILQNDIKPLGIIKEDGKNEEIEKRLKSRL